MLFSWDESKRRENLERRKVDLAEAAMIFADPEIIESTDTRSDYGEQRIQALGQAGGVYYVVAYTWRGDKRHLITAWKVGEDGRRRYQAIFARRAEGDAGEGADNANPGRRS